MSTAIALVLDPWRQTGCGDRCKRWRASDGRYVEAHCPATHEQYGAASVALLGQRRDLPIVRTGPLVIDRAAALVLLNGEAIRLSRLEYSILSLLADNLGRLVTQDEIMRTVWGRDYAVEEGRRRTQGAGGFKNIARVTLARLRHKLGSAGGLVETRFNLGLILRQEPAS